jgi:branched-subunit amino acid ABC-type transport system permease component
MDRMRGADGHQRQPSDFLTFFIGGALAAVARHLLRERLSAGRGYMGAWLGTKSFIAAVLGGIGDIAAHARRNLSWAFRRSLPPR